MDPTKGIPLDGFDGWGGVDPSPEMLKQLQESVASTDELDFAKAMFGLFATPLGQTVLEGIRKHTVEQSCWPNEVSDGAALALMAAHREGENNLYRWIVSMIEKGRKSE